MARLFGIGLGIWAALLQAGPVGAQSWEETGETFDISVLHGQNLRTQGDRGRWVRWPDEEGKPFLRLAFFETDEEGGVSLWMALSNEESSLIGPADRSRRFEGRFDPAGFDLELHCKAEDFCLGRETHHPKRHQALVAAGAETTYRYHVEVLTRRLIRITAYTPRVVFAGEQLVAFEDQAVVREIYLTRDDDCSRSLDTIRTELIDGEFADRFLVALGSPAPLARGALVEESGPVPREVFKTSRASCFFYLDLVPTAAHAHPVLYVLTDRESGEITEREWAVMPPRITDPGREGGEPRVWYETIEERLGSPDQVFPKRPEDLERAVLEGPFQLSPPSPGIVAKRRPDMDSWLRETGPGRAPRPAQPMVRLASLSGLREPALRSRLTSPRPQERGGGTCEKTRKVAVLVNGGKNLPFDRSIWQMTHALEQMGFDTVAQRTWERHSLEQVRQTIRELSAPLGQCDVFLLYVVAHVVADSGCVACDMGGYKTDGEVFYNWRLEPISAHPWHISNLSSNMSNSVGIETGPGLLYEFRDIEAGHMEIILDMCNAGLLIDAATTEWAGPPIAGFLSKSQTLTLISATSRNRMADIAREADYSFWMGFVGRGDAWGEGNVFTQILARRFGDEAPGADEDGDATIDRLEFDRASRRAMEATLLDFEGVFDRWLRGRVQDPLSHHVRGELP